MNRYRPNGLYDQMAWEGNGDAWGDWGISLYGFENEPNVPYPGYGESQAAVADLAEKLYRQYQMIKTISVGAPAAAPRAGGGSSGARRRLPLFLRSAGSGSPAGRRRKCGQLLGLFWQLSKFILPRSCPRVACRKILRRGVPFVEVQSLGGLNDELIHAICVEVARANARHAEYHVILESQAAGADPLAPQNSGFGRGLYARRSLTQNATLLAALPESYRMGQNYPNPFNAETVIPLELPQKSRLRLELFNVCGQSVGVIFEGVQNAGRPNIHYNASRLASGLYFCRVTAEGLESAGRFSDVRKLLLLK